MLTALICALGPVLWHWLSTGNELAGEAGMTFVKVEKRGSYAILSLAREPVNSLNTEVWSQLKAAFDALEADPDVRGVVFASGLSRPVFTAGE